MWQYLETQMREPRRKQLQLNKILERTDRPILGELFTSYICIVPPHLNDVT